MEMPKPATAESAVSPVYVAPLSANAAYTLRVAGWIIAGAGMILGLVVVFSAPDEQRFSYSESARLINAARTTQLVWGWSVLVGSFLTGLFVHVTSGIALIAIELWEKLVKEE
jgi:succinate dehydrogenase/fumarate reductase cytochrome b subunit